MKTGRYSLKELLTHNEIEQIIIPEIQRDYVWQESNVTSLIESIIERFKKKNKSKIEINIEGKQIEKSFNEYLQKEYDKLKNNLKVGFIYAYHDNDYAGKFFLIDGQQRFTTLYLLLLATYVSNKKPEIFKEIYFKHEVLKIDYKVRESSHEFMKELVKNELHNNNPAEIKNSNRYYKYLYNKDVTIVNLISNYNVICRLIGDKDLLRYDKKDLMNKEGNLDEFIEFVEDFIEVNYFDTNVSEQGEQLYLYMNSRGEFLSHHEIVKTEIVKKVGEGNEFTEKKKIVGDNWETWQNFFWNKRGNNENADLGFDEFLKWVTIIDICTLDSPIVIFETSNIRFQTLREAKENYIHRNKPKLNKQKEYLAKYQLQCIESDYLKYCFEAVKFLSELKSNNIPLLPSWLNDVKSTINYIVILPLIYFIKNSHWTDDNEMKKHVERMAMFLKNITFFESVSKNPDSAVIDAIELVKRLCDQGEKDIIHWESDTELDGKYKSILTPSEREKLRLYKNSGNNRDQLEKVIWNITHDERVSTFIKGNISILTYTVNSKDANNSLIESIDSIKIQFIGEYYNILSEIISNYDLDKGNDKADIFRRVLLTFGDYVVNTSGSYRFGNRIEGYTFGYYFNRDNKEWEEIFESKRNILADFFYTIRTKQPLDLIDFISTYKENDWKAPFIKNKELLMYCNKKRILFESEHRILLIEEKDKGYKEIQCFLLCQQFQEYNMEMYAHNICVLNINYSYIEQKLIFERSKYAIDIIKNGDLWHSTLVNKDEHNLKNKLDMSIFDGWVQVDGSNDRIKKKEKVHYNICLFT